MSSIKQHLTVLPTVFTQQLSMMIHNYYPFWRIKYCPIYRQIHRQNGLHSHQAEVMNNDTAEYKLHDVRTSRHHLRPKMKGENKLEALIPRICL